MIISCSDSKQTSNSDSIYLDTTYTFNIDTTPIIKEKLVDTAIYVEKKLTKEEEKRQKKYLMISLALNFIKLEQNHLILSK